METTTMNRDATVPTSVPASSSNRGKIVILLLFAAAIGTFFYFDLGRYLSLEALKSNRDALLAFADQHFASAVALYIAIYCIVVAVSLPGAAILTLAGGFLFGSVLGTVFVNLGATTGATLAFLAARYLLRDWVETKFGERIAPVQEGFSKNAFSYLMTLRLIPLFPFFLVNLVSGLTRISLATYVAATALDHPRHFCLCKRRPAVGLDQFAERRRLACCPGRLRALGPVCSCPGSVPEVPWQGMT